MILFASLLSFWAVIWCGVGLTVVRVMLAAKPETWFARIPDVVLLAIAFLLWAVIGFGFGSFLFVATGAPQLRGGRVAGTLFRLAVGGVLGLGVGVAAWAYFGVSFSDFVACWNMDPFVRQVRCGW
jgi:hypothetical protein